jgi:mannose-1-phosphate guanylyltransferase
MPGSAVRSGAVVSDSILASGAVVGERSTVSGNAILGEGVIVPADTNLDPGVKLSGSTGAS